MKKPFEDETKVYEWPGGMRVVTHNCAGPDTPRGKFANIASDARLGEGSTLGFWTVIGPGVKVGRNSPLGDWTTIGPFSRIGSLVRIGSWTKFGMDVHVDAGVRLDEHEFIPSGTRVHLFGRRTRLERSPEDAEIHHWFDEAVTRRDSDSGEGFWSEHIQRDADAEHAEAVARFNALLPSYLERKVAQEPDLLRSRLMVLSGLAPPPVDFKWALVSSVGPSDEDLPEPILVEGAIDLATGAPVEDDEEDAAYRGMGM